MMTTNLIQKNSFFIFSILFFTSCSQIKVSTPSSRFTSPEAQGKLFSGSFRMEQVTGTEGTLDFGGDKIDNEMELRNNTSSLGLNFDIGLVEQVDLTIKSSMYTPNIYTVKFQILGDPRLKAQKGNKSLAASIGYGSQEQSQSESDFELFSDSKNIEADIINTMLELSVIYGYRPENDTLVYTSVQAIKHDIDFKLKSTTNTTLDDKSFALHTWAYGASLGATRYFESY